MMNTMIGGIMVDKKEDMNMEMLEIIHQNNRRIKEQKRMQEELRLAKERQEELEYELEQQVGKRNNIILFSSLIVCTLILWLGLALGL